MQCIHMWKKEIILNNKTLLFWRDGQFGKSLSWGVPWLSQSVIRPSGTGKCPSRAPVGHRGELQVFSWVFSPEQSQSVTRKRKATVWGASLPQLTKKTLTKKQKRALSHCPCCRQYSPWEGLKGRQVKFLKTNCTLLSPFILGTSLQGAELNI